LPFLCIFFGFSLTVLTVCVNNPNPFWTCKHTFVLGGKFPIYMQYMYVVGENIKFISTSFRNR